MRRTDIARIDPSTRPPAPPPGQPRIATPARLLLAGLVAVALGAGALAQEAPWQPERGGAAPPGREGGASTSSTNPFLGGVPSTSRVSGSTSLTLRGAIDLGLRNNLGALLSRQSVRAAEAGQSLARGALLPSVSAGISGAREEIDLEAYGFPVAPGESPVVGPFNVVDARVYLAQPILDMAARQRSKAGAEGAESARLGEQDARELVVMTCASLYLQAAMGVSRIEAARAQAAVADSLHQRAVRLKESGVVAGIEVLRAQVQFESQRQRVIFYENEYAKEKLALARAIGLPLSQPFELAEKLPFRPFGAIDPAATLGDAYASRADLRQAESAVQAAESTWRADRYDALPSLRFDADWGVIGPNADHLERTFSLAAGLRIPLFEGGRIRARATADDAALQQARALRDNLRSRIEFEVRAALLDLGAAEDRVRVTQGALDLAQEQLRQSQDRFSSGVAGNLEVVQAQDAVATSSDNYLSALYAHNTARLALARATGTVERAMDGFLTEGKEAKP